MAGLAFSKSRRLAGRGVFKRIMDAGRRQTAGPLVIFSIANDVGHPRLGISTPKRLGKANVRNRCRRVIREAFRHEQAAGAGGFDIIMLVRSHAELPGDSYRLLLRAAFAKLQR